MEISELGPGDSFWGIECKKCTRQIAVRLASDQRDGIEVPVYGPTLEICCGHPECAALNRYRPDQLQHFTVGI